jgi:DNA-binding NarL/FixJ family response regulator
MVMALNIHPAELAVLRKLAEGLTSREIAEELNLPADMISKHQKSVYRKTGKSDPLQALQALAKQGFTIVSE